MTGPRIANPKKGRTKAEYNAYMRGYMRTYREGFRCVYKHEKPTEKVMAEAIVLPLPIYADVTAALMGDPPIGRRALDKVI